MLTIISACGYTPPNAMSPLTVSTSFEDNKNYKDFATLSPISPALAAYSFSSADSARKRLSMHIPSTSPLSLSLGGENNRDFDALCLLYPYLPSPVSQQGVPGTPPNFSPTKLPTTSSHPTLAAIPPSLSLNFARPQSAPQAFSNLLHQPLPPQTNSFTPRPVVAQQTPPLTPQTKPIQQPPQPILQSTPSTTPVSSPKLVQKSSTQSTNAATTTNSDRKDRYSNRDRSSGITNSSLNSSSSGSPKMQIRTAAGSVGAKYSTAKSPGRRDTSTGSANNSSTTASKRKAKLEGSLVLGKKPAATITHTNTENSVSQDTKVTFMIP